MQDGLVARRSVQVAHVLLVVAAAYAGALAVSAAIGLWLEEDTPRLPRSSPASAPVTAPQRRPKQSDISIIFKRNLFGSEPLAASETDSASSASAFNLRLIGTAKVDSRGYAVFEEAAGHGQDVFAVGERVFDGPKLVSVGENQAVLLYQGRKRTIKLTDASAEAIAGRASGAKASDASGGIRKTGENSYLLDRREVEHTLENLNTVITQMRAVPFLRDGKSLGFRVFNIRPGSIFDRMGLRNGDVVQRINGTDLNSPANAMGLLDTVADASQIRVDLLRGDKLESLNYRIQ